MLSRIILYAAALGVAASLIWPGFIREPDLGFDPEKDRVLALAGEGKFDEARALLDELRDEYPEEIQVPLLSGWIEDGTGNLDAARSAYERALVMTSVAEQKRELLVTIADLDRRQGHVARAEETLNDVTGQYGHFAKSRHLRVLILIDKGLYQEALSEVERMDEEGVVNPHAYRLRRHVERLLEPTPEDSRQVKLGSSSQTR